MVVKRSFWEELFAPKIRKSTEIAFGGKRGGARPGAGRKKTKEKLVEEEKEKIQEMIISRKLLLIDLHNTELRESFVQALRDAIVSNKAQEKAWALRILAEIYLKTPIPKEALEESKETTDVVAELLKQYEEYEDELSEGLLRDVQIDDPAEQADSAGKETDSSAAEEFLP